MTQYTLDKDSKRASRMMWDACTGGAGAWVQCDCGTEWSIDQELTEEEIDNDDYDYDDHTWFRYVELDGKTFVEDCEECDKKLGRYERWIWNERETIRDYLKIRVDQQFKWAEQEKLRNILAGIK